MRQLPGHPEGGRPVQLRIMHILAFGIVMHDNRPHFFFIPGKIRPFHAAQEENSAVEQSAVSLVFQVIIELPEFYIIALG